MLQRLKMCSICTPKVALRVNWLNSFPLIRCDETQVHVWLLSVWLMEANGPGLSDLAIEM